ncbi:hypothetical protein [Xylocopilactobacillus apis]|uniref:Uncharacterized protein n=1 Tax=Xylocopilactobacillus apis TaxID=2932183 RepID=A0AAU9DGA8_9LACO|nr:hypothetical protein [Xylocopilactobacillus apis]BDR55752.1 hypothetical protein KIMC2_03140 [Xylocopilactobacillus apis]
MTMICLPTIKKRHNLLIKMLAEVRRIITEKFDDELGEDDMEKIKYWEKPGCRALINNMP